MLVLSSLLIDIPIFIVPQFSHSVVSNSLRPHGLQHTRLPCLYHQLPELAQTHAPQVSDGIQKSHPLSSPPPALSLSQHQGLFQWVSSSYQVAKYISPILTTGISSKKWRTFFHLFNVTSCQGWNWDSSPNAMYFPALYSVLKLGSLLSFLIASLHSNCPKLVLFSHLVCSMAPF